MAKRVLRIGFFADGVWKGLVGLAMLALLPWLVGNLGAPPLLLVITAVPVLANAAAEITYAIRDGGGTHTKFLIGYDAGWFIVSAAAVTLAVTGRAGAWELWLGYQLVAATAAAAIFAIGARRGHGHRPDGLGSRAT